MPPPTTRYVITARHAVDAKAQQLTCITYDPVTVARVRAGLERLEFVDIAVTEGPVAATAAAASAAEPVAPRSRRRKAA